MWSGLTEELLELYVHTGSDGKVSEDKVCDPVVWMLLGVPPTSEVFTPPDLSPVEHLWDERDQSDPPTGHLQGSGGVQGSTTGGAAQGTMGVPQNSVFVTLDGRKPGEFP